jgi:hypothetical protein
MINIRYHVYSLVAVFLALAIGVAAGSTVVQRSVVDNLRSNQGRIEKNLDSLQAENGDLRARITALEKRSGSLSDAGPTTLLADELVGKPVVLIRVQGVAGDVLDRVRNALSVAGAETVADIEVKAASTDPDTLTALADQLGLDPDQRQPEQVEQAVGEQLGTLLAAIGTTASGRVGQATAHTTIGDTEPPATDPEPSREARALRDYANALDNAGLLSVRGTLGKDAGVPDQAPDVLIIGGMTTQFDPVPLLHPLLDVLADADRPVTLAADASLANPPNEGEKASGIVATVRGAGRLRDRVSTVDVLDDFAGLAAMVLGLADLAGGQIGHYGVGEGADALLPTRHP